MDVEITSYNKATVGLLYDVISTSIGLGQITVYKCFAAIITILCIYA